MAGLGRGVAAVGEGVDHDLDAGFGERAGECCDLVLVGVHAAGRQQPHQMGPPAGFAQLGDVVLEVRIVVDLAALESAVDARQILQHDAAGAEVHVADLGVAELAFGQADVGAVRA